MFHRSVNLGEIKQTFSPINQNWSKAVIWEKQQDGREQGDGNPRKPVNQLQLTRKKPNYSFLAEEDPNKYFIFPGIFTLLEYLLFWERFTFTPYRLITLGLRQLRGAIFFLHHCLPPEMNGQRNIKENPVSVLIRHNERQKKPPHNACIILFTTFRRQSGLEWRIKHKAK